MTPDTCTDCGHPFPEEGPPAPCPECGSARRDRTLVAEPGAYELSSAGPVGWEKVRTYVERNWRVLSVSAALVIAGLVLGLLFPGPVATVAGVVLGLLALALPPWRTRVREFERSD